LRSIALSERTPNFLECLESLGMLAALQAFQGFSKLTQYGKPTEWQGAIGQACLRSALH
jgi:hypothetical protein